MMTSGGLHSKNNKCTTDSLALLWTFFLNKMTINRWGLSCDSVHKFAFEDVNTFLNVPDFHTRKLYACHHMSILHSQLNPTFKIKGIGV